MLRSNFIAFLIQVIFFFRFSYFIFCIFTPFFFMFFFITYARIKHNKLNFEQTTNKTLLQMHITSGNKGVRYLPVSFSQLVCMAIKCLLASTIHTQNRFVLEKHTEFKRIKVSERKWNLHSHQNSYVLYFIYLFIYFV